MDLIERRGVGSASGESGKPLSTEDVLSSLRDPGAVNFSYLASHIPHIEGEVLEEVRQLGAAKIFNTMLGGHFNDLRGVPEFMGKVGLSISLPNQTITKINELIRRIRPESMISLGLAQSGVQGEYNIDDSRRILEGNGFFPDELSDDAIKEVLNLRHVVSALQERNISQIDPQEPIVPQLASESPIT